MGTIKEEVIQVITIGPTTTRRILDYIDTTLTDKVCQCLAAGRWFSPGSPVSSTNKTNRHDIT